MVPVRFGLIGCGGYGRFVLDAVAALPAVRVVALSDSDPARLAQARAATGAAAYAAWQGLIADPAVEAVWIATPPADHGAMALAALQAGRHVFCEKPLATSRQQAEAIAAAARRGLVVGIDYVLRWNPLYRLAEQALRSAALGELRHMSLENDAADENLPAGHWFWDPARSGGIFVEHGVHFFDMAAHLAGAAGRVVYSEAWRRPAAPMVERVLSVVHFGGVPATFYHSFDKAARSERTEFRLACDRGYIQVRGWMPTELELEADVDEAGAGALSSLGQPGVSVQDEILATYGEADGQARGRGLAYRVSQHRRLRFRLPAGKTAAYQDCLRAGAADFARAVREPGHALAVTLRQAKESLQLALECSEKAVVR